MDIKTQRQAIKYVIRKFRAASGYAELGLMERAEEEIASAVENVFCLKLISVNLWRLLGRKHLTKETVPLLMRLRKKED